MVYGLRAEFRRIPVTYGFSLKYYLDNFIDSLDVIQQILSNLSFINLFKVIYLGQQINCSYQIPDTYQTEYMMEFDGITTDSKFRTISLELEVSTNFPVLHVETVIPADMFIKKTVLGIPNRHGIILHSKGGLDTEPGEISCEETVEINPES